MFLRNYFEYGALVFSLVLIDCASVSKCEVLFSHSKAPSCPRRMKSNTCFRFIYFLLSKNSIKISWHQRSNASFRFQKRNVVCRCFLFFFYFNRFIHFHTMQWVESKIFWLPQRIFYKQWTDSVLFKDLK